jgi:hypothetical protein
MALICSTWLVHSMAESLGGGFWNYLIAGAFDYSPILIASAPIAPRYQRLTLWGSCAIFVIGLLLYLAPYVQTLSNELSLYAQASQHYQTELDRYRSQSKASQELTAASQKAHEQAEAAYQSQLEQYGSNSWRTATAKRHKEEMLTKWRDIANQTLVAVKPEIPTYSDGLRQALQEIIKRVGLFGIAFLSIFVMRNLLNFQHFFNKEQRHLV